MTELRRRRPDFLRRLAVAAARRAWLRLLDRFDCERARRLLVRELTPGLPAA
jgi:hypothetical protein